MYIKKYRIIMGFKVTTYLKKKLSKNYLEIRNIS